MATIAAQPSREVKKANSPSSADFIDEQASNENGKNRSKRCTSVIHLPYCFGPTRESAISVGADAPTLSYAKITSERQQTHGEENARTDTVVVKDARIF